MNVSVPQRNTDEYSGAVISVDTDFWIRLYTVWKNMLLFFMPYVIGKITI